MANLFFFGGFAIFLLVYGLILYNQEKKKLNRHEH